MPTFTELYLEFGAKMAKGSLENPGAFCSTLIKDASQRNNAMNAYRALLASLKIIPIEELPTAKKMEYWEMAKKDNAGRLDIEKLKVVCKCLYMIDHYISNNPEWLKPNQRESKMEL